jgi:hypothetical protein
MEYTPYEPQPPAPAARPCSTPHSAPAAWLQSQPTPEPLPPDPLSPLRQPTLSKAELDSFAAIAIRDPNALADAIARACPEGIRGDGWTPFARRLFLQVLADTGRVTLACEYAGLSRQSAHALRTRDPLFAAGWDAAALIARNPLADDILEKSFNGVTDTVTRNGEVIATRHRYDSRLSMAVLHRLDKRCDRAEELGSKHFTVARRWGEWLDLIGRGDEQGAQALLDSGEPETVQHCQNRQLPETENPTPIGDPPGWDPSENVWRNDDGVWMTTFPPPPGFDGHESGPWDGFNYYDRACTAEEAELIDSHTAAVEAEDRAEAEAQRDKFFAELRAELRAVTHLNRNAENDLTRRRGDAESRRTMPEPLRVSASPREPKCCPDCGYEEFKPT